MKAWLLVFLMFVSGSYLFADVALSVAQGSREYVQNERELAQGNTQLQQRLAQAEQPKPERPIRQIRPNIAPLVRPQVQPPPPEPWYKNSTVIVSIISAVAAIVVALLGLLKRG